MAKLFSAPHAPAKCAKCGQLSSAPAQSSRVISTLLLVTLVGTAWYALAVRSWWPLLALALAAAALVGATVHFVPLISVSDKQAKRNFRRGMVRTAGYGAVLLALMLGAYIAQKWA